MSNSVSSSKIGGLVLSKTGTGGSSRILDRLMIENLPEEIPDLPGLQNKNVISGLKRKYFR